MLQTLARKPKSIAWFFVTLFYLQLVLIPVVTRANARPLPKTIQSYKTGRQLFDKNENSKALEEPAINRQAVELKNPAHVKGIATTGPTQPEMQSFLSVNGNNLVDPFSGDFSYNIPLLDVGGYPVNLHYQSGITMDQEASWVGLGWNINPGVISRNMRGLPDDFQGEADIVEKTTAMKPNTTTGITIGGNMELLGASKTTVPSPGDTVKGRTGTLGASLGIFHNTYKGWGSEFGLNANINAGKVGKGTLTAGLSITNNSQDGLDVSPSISLNLAKEAAKSKGDITIGTNYNSRTGIQNLQITGQMKRSDNDRKKFSGSHAVGISFAKPSYTPTINVPYTTNAYSITAKVGSELWGFHPNGYIRGYTSKQEIETADRTSRLPVYGYLYYEKAGNNRNVLLDFNREKDVPFTDNSPHIAVPIYTYDTWSISGEGTGGMFRAYRGDIGYVFDHTLSTKSNSSKFSLDLGFGNIFHAGVDFNGVYAVSKNRPWEADNNFTTVIPFKQQAGKFENVYFKNPGEKTAVNKRYLQAIGNDSLMRVSLYAHGKNSPQVMTTRLATLFKDAKPVATRLFDDKAFRSERDKRTQVISYLNAQEAAHGGLDKKIRTYAVNSFPNGTCYNNYVDMPRVDPDKKAHHLSEISVLNADGRRYIYGVPVYNKKQTEATMSTDTATDKASGLVKYDSMPRGTGTIGNSVDNGKGKDGYYNREEMSAYAHSFLLSGILSSDYVDITGDGITNDDYGDAVKFNYSQVYSTNDPYKWRAPFEKYTAFYNEGLKTDSRDEKGSFTYGEREVWYLNSVESKTMIATFVLDTDSLRQDGYGVEGEEGGIEVNRRLYRLKQINLYTKADYLKNGGAAKPIKTVHFAYSYELCKGNAGSLAGKGKLTLKKVWFEYNGNSKGKRNPYIFTYNAVNPDYNSKSVDRWGNYKNSSDNPGSAGKALTNADYPYALQKGVKSWDADSAAKYAAPWTLSAIKLPSGARMEVTYESDDYAYVQNRRAMQLFSIAGFGSNENSVFPRLYPSFGSGDDYHYVFVNVPDAVNNPEEIKRKYLEGVTKLFFKLAVSVPGDKWGKGYEIVPVYTDIESYGVKSGSDNKTIWIKVKPVKNNESPFTTAALQFLRLNLPAKAYPFSEPGDNLDFRTFGGMFATIAQNVSIAISGFRGTSRGKNWCNNLDINSSFVRLNNPEYKKLGGGLRVKRVELFDNWNKMTGQQESTYGQTYDYTTEIVIDDDTTRISSGVATYEPMIGNDENPFRVPQKLYTVNVGALAPADYMFTEEPFAETFFPAPMIGYSKIRVQTIHKDKKSANGYDETEFYTAKDFPVIVEYTPIDNDSKKTYNPVIGNFLKLDVRHYVTLSQGFKIELNDMHGKLKSQSTYAQNQPEPISYTFNYYRLKNDNAGQPALSNTVAMVDSSSGNIDMSAQMGIEVELMADVREETSNTVSGSIEVNLDWVNHLPPVVVGSGFALPSFESNRYRSIAVLKIVNRYGILDSVLHIEKGSRVTTRNLLYDGETGDVLLSQTNNEFDDPVYNFSYPAHWAYKGMGPAYENIGMVLNKVNFRKGIMMYPNGQRVQVDKDFESGDEVLVYGYDNRNSSENNYCDPDYYVFDKTAPKYRKIWAVDASRGKEGQKGIYFIDRDGIPYTADAEYIRIIRSGKRNLSGVPVGSVTSLATPLKKVNGDWRIVFDSATHVIAANAARFKDLWKVDSTLYQKDTLVPAPRLVTSQQVTLVATDHYGIRNYKESNGGNRDLELQPNYEYFEASSYNNPGSGSDEERKGYLRFDMSGIPQGALITSAKLHLLGRSNELHRNSRISNACYLERLKRGWPRDVIPGSNDGNIISDYFYDEEHNTIDQNNRVTLPETARDLDVARNDTVVITDMAQDMLNHYYSSNGEVSPAMRISLIEVGNDDDGKRSRLTYSSGQLPQYCPGIVPCNPYIVLTYYAPCNNGAQPFPPGSESDPEARSMSAFAALPGYYCMDGLKDSSVCRPNINDTALNYYRFGVLGNWRMDRAYTYYSHRMQTDPSDTTDIRTDGEIKDFQPYWTFTNGLLSASTDTSRWVWNSEMTRFNNKGYEIENHDPLNRYNAGIYGYNQTLPIAVAQNAKNREIAFDGFEDYGYQTSNCKNCLVNRHVDFGSDADLVDTVSHTGLYSLRVPGNYTVTKFFKVGNMSQEPELSMKEDSIPLVTTTVNGNGNGLSGQVNAKYNTNGVCITGSWFALDEPTRIDWNSTGNQIQGVCRTENFNVKWNGFVQPRYTGTYTFLGIADDHMSVKIKINGVETNITQGTGLEGTHNWTDLIPMQPVQLEAGELYEISVEWTAGDGFNEVELQWQSQGMQTQAREIVPRTQLYPATTDINATKAATVHRDTAWCVKFNNPTAKRVVHEKFSPLQKQKVVVSAWVKQEGECIGSSYNNTEMVLVFDNSNGPNYVFPLKPSGNIIEGWQRIEDTLTIPENTNYVAIYMRSTSTAPVYFDDIRVTPFNGNMKSFVYNPVNLRLMAELDENNYATFYEYDDEGTLIRLKKETERGIKTIKETRSAMLKE